MAGILTESNRQTTDTVNSSPDIKKPQAKMSELNGISKPLDVSAAPVTNGDCMPTKVTRTMYFYSNYTSF